MSRNYKIRDQTKQYFVSFAVVYWVDVFIRPPAQGPPACGRQACALQNEKKKSIMSPNVTFSTPIHVASAVHQGWNGLFELIRDTRIASSDSPTDGQVTVASEKK